VNLEDHGISIINEKDNIYRLNEMDVYFKRKCLINAFSRWSPSKSTI